MRCLMEGKYFSLAGFYLLSTFSSSRITLSIYLSFSAFPYEVGFDFGYAGYTY